MKIYKKIVVDMNTFETIFEDSFEHAGPVSLCKGGEVNTQDHEYNMGNLEISKDQQQMAKKLFNQFQYGVTYDPNTKISGYMSKDGNLVDYNGKVLVGKDDLEKAGIGADGTRSAQSNESNGATRSAQSNPLKKIKEKAKEWTGSSDTGIAIASSAVPLAPFAGETYLAKNYYDKMNPDGTPTPMSSDIPAGSKEISISHGDLYGYDPSVNTSEMQYLQNIVNANQSILGKQTDVEKASLETQLKQLGLTDAQIVTQLSLLPQEEKLARSNIDLGLAKNTSEQSLIPQRSRLESATIQDTLTGIGQRAPVREKLFKEALNGVDVGQKQNQAQAEVEQAFKNSEADTRRTLMGYGLDPSSGQYISSIRSRDLEKSAAIAGARTKAGNDAEAETFNRLRSVMTTI